MPRTAARNTPSRIRPGVFSFLAAVLLSGAAAEAQRPIPTRPYWKIESGFLALQQAVRDASSDTQVLLLASHPDDRYVLPAAYLRFRHGHRVAVVLFTRGKGGQNSQGPETGDELGRIRTLEAEAGASQLGIRMHYLNRPDGGFTRSSQEALDQWGRKSAAEDLARLIRKIAPDLMITTHHPEEIHGHDLALLEVVKGALELAGKAEFKTPGFEPHIVKRYFRGRAPSEKPDVSLDMTQLDPSRGETYRTLAYAALKEHVSQRPLQPMEQLLEPQLELVAVNVPGTPREMRLLEGLPDLWSGLEGGTNAEKLRRAKVRSSIDRLRFHLGDRERLAKVARDALDSLAVLQVPEALGRRHARRAKALERVVLHASGLQARLKLDRQQEVVTGDEVPLEICLRNDGVHSVTLLSIVPEGGSLSFGKREADRNRVVAPRKNLTLRATYRPPDLSEDQIRGLFVGDRFEPPLRVRFRVRIGKNELEFVRLIRRDVLPPFELEVSPQPLLLAKDSDHVRFVVSIRRNTSRKLRMRLRVKAPAGMSIQNGVRQVVMQEERFVEYAFRLNAPRTLQPGVHNLFVKLNENGREKKLKVRVHKVDVRVPADLRVGLIRGRDDTAKQVLQSLIGGRNLTVFEANEPLPILDQKRFHTIVVDIRAMRSRKLRPAAARLIDFVRNGGRLVVFYHKDAEFNLTTAGFRGAPYSMVIGKGRVTREDAPVKLLDEGHLLFTSPNKIRPGDWDGWRQERGLYFPKAYDPKFQELLELNDPGHPAERGSLLYARYGKGEYVYCALSLYRQLKNLHPGGCRLFANLVSARLADD